MAGISLHEQRAVRARRAFATLPERYLGAPEWLRGRVDVRLSDLGRSWEVGLEARRCRVIAPARGKGDVAIDTDTATWLALRAGRLSSLEAFAARRVHASGDVEMAIAFEGLFRLPGGRPPLMRVHRVSTTAGRIATITSGTGPEHVICIHGLGATKSSFFSTIATLSGERTVHALDLPGFGNSDKPPRAPYDARFFAAVVRELMDRMEIDRAHLIGNSMGGRVALELALADPDRVHSLGLLAPALAFLRRRRMVPLVRLIRPELAALPHSLGADRVRAQLHDMFADPDRLDPALADVATEEFLNGFASRAARIAFYSAARNIYLDPPHGEGGLWTRLAALSTPALFVWGTHDRLVPPAFSRHVARVLPRARQQVLERCGHVPQIEMPERTNRLLEGLIDSASPRKPRPAAVDRRGGRLHAVRSRLRRTA